MSASGPALVPDSPKQLLPKDYTNITQAYPVDSTKGGLYTKEQLAAIALSTFIGEAKPAWVSATALR